MPPSTPTAALLSNASDNDLPVVERSAAGGMSTTRTLREVVAPLRTLNTRPRRAAGRRTGRHRPGPAPRAGKAFRLRSMRPVQLRGLRMRRTP
jgi:hypothetical protein